MFISYTDALGAISGRSARADSSGEKLQLLYSQIRQCLRDAFDRRTVLKLTFTTTDQFSLKVEVESGDKCALRCDKVAEGRVKLTRKRPLSASSSLQREMALQGPSAKPCEGLQRYVEMRDFSTRSQDERD